MSRVRLPSAIALAAALAAVNARASDEPHASTYSVQCESCHSIHKPAGGNLTTVLGNQNVCASCHNAAGIASRYDVALLMKADLPSAAGASHAWNVMATNPAAGASLPSNAQMKARLDAGQIVCSTCHNEHLNPSGAAAARTAGTQARSPVAHVAGSGTGTVSYAASTVASAKGYLLEIVETATRFRLSNDGGISWWGWSGSAWVPYAAGNARPTGSGLFLNDGTNVSVSFSGSFAIGDRYRFHVGYPFLRTALDSGPNATGAAFCRDCHTAFTNDADALHTWTGAERQHPVGLALGANGQGYDRALPLDGDGSADDGNPTNDLRLAVDGTVQCFTCHGVHHAPGNTQYVWSP